MHDKLRRKSQYAVDSRIRQQLIWTYLMNGGDEVG